MRIKYVVIEDEIKKKILDKHNIEATEIKDILLNNPYILKAKGERYMAIGWSHKYLTIIFELEEDNIAFIITAYPSSDTQRKLYKHKKL